MLIRVVILSILDVFDAWRNRTTSLLLRNRTKITTKVKYLGAGTLVPFYGTKLPTLSIYFLVLLNRYFPRSHPSSVGMHTRA